LTQFNNLSEDNKNIMFQKYTSDKKGNSRLFYNSFTHENLLSILPKYIADELIVSTKIEFTTEFYTFNPISDLLEEEYEKRKSLNFKSESKEIPDKKQKTKINIPTELSNILPNLGNIIKPISPTIPPEPLQLKRNPVFDVNKHYLAANKIPQIKQIVFYYDGTVVTAIGKLPYDINGVIPETYEYDILELNEEEQKVVSRLRANYNYTKKCK
jgi:hypothetical protein